MSKEKKITDRGYWECKNPDIYKFDLSLARELASKLQGKTVLDLGCGNGAYTDFLNLNGVECCGCDGNPHTPDITNNCTVCDLSKPVEMDQTEWVMCLEVAEHVPKEFESTVVKNIKKLNTEGIILSWAVPGQGGHGHVNNRPNEYVRNLFSEYAEDYAWEKELRESAGLSWFKETIMVFKR